MALFSKITGISGYLKHLLFRCDAQLKAFVAGLQDQLTAETGVFFSAVKHFEQVAFIRIWFLETLQPVFVDINVASATGA